MASYNIYCTFDDLIDVYPNIDEYDTKTPIYGFEKFETTLTPNLPGRNLLASYNTGKIKSLFINGKDQGNAATSFQTITEEGNTWNYDSTTDRLVVYSEEDLNTNLVEKGDNWVNVKNRIINQASRFFDSRVDASVSREQFRDKNGEYDYIVVRTTALLACKFLINGYDPESPIALSFDEEINFNIDLINTGKAKLSHQVSSDSSSGVVRIIKIVNPRNNLNLVDTRGHYNGVYDRIKVICTTKGVIGTAKIDVFNGDYTDGIKTHHILKDELVTGLYQNIGSGIQIRFQGKDSNSIMEINDEWEIEVFGKGEEIDDLGSNNIMVTKMTRGGRGY